MKRNNLRALFVFFCLPMLFSCAEDASFAPETSGRGGSMARFAIAKNHLYLVDFTSLKYYDIGNALSPSYVGAMKIEDGIETIFSYNDNLFVGSMAGVHIFDIGDPKHPKPVSVYRHIVACDPVVVSGEYAYATLRSSGCRQWGENLLDVIDVSDLSHPVNIKSLPMTGPYGLGIADTLLFVCDGDRGLMIFNIKDPASPELFNQIESIHGYDVIPMPERKDVIITGNKGIYQYDYSDPYQIQYLSVINIE